jgi:uncharacterized membrane protein
VWPLFFLPAACIAALLNSKAHLAAISCGVLEYLADSALLPLTACPISCLRAACNAAQLISRDYLIAMSCGVLEYLL